MKKLLTKAAPALAFILLLGNSAFAKDVYEDSYFCAGVITYMANYSLVLEERGRATLLTIQAARSMVFNFYVNLRGDVVPGERVAVIKEHQRKSKPYMDGLSHQAKYDELNRCIDLSSKNFRSISDKGGRLFGVPVTDAASRAAKTMQQELGLR
ncbi:MAG: hypothetical protein WD852_05890 [Methyloceanibacter sp.]